MGLPRATFAKLSPYPYLLANLDPPGHKVPPTRSNGRAPDEARPPTVNLSSLSHPQGSAIVRMGDTSAICGIRAETILTSNIPSYSPSNVETELKDYRLIVPNIELATGCAPQFLPGGPPSTLAQVLSTRLYSLLHSSKLIQPDDLRIPHSHPALSPASGLDSPIRMDADTADETASRPVAAYWVLYIDVFFISYDGNPFDAAWAATLAALKDTKIPRARHDADRNLVICSRDDPRPLNLNGMPVACTAAVLIGKSKSDRPVDGKHWLLVDPDMLEESLCEESVTIVIDCTAGDAQILSLSKYGGIVLGLNALSSQEFFAWAAKRWHHVATAITSRQF